MTRVISTSSVRPERLAGDDESEISGKIDLGPCDLQLLLVDYIQKGLLFRKPPNTTTPSLLVRHLKAAFSQTVNIFYPLAGRLISTNNDDDDTTSFLIDCNGAGAEFVHATADGKVSVADILDPVVVPDEVVYSFFTMNKVLNHEAAVSSLPLLSAQVTELADGVFVACSVNHCAADGTFFWRFLKTWSEIARAGDGTDGNTLRRRRVFGRGFLDSVVDLPLRVPNHFLACPAVAERRSLERLRQRMFRFSKAKVAELKARANAEAGAGSEISSLQALLAHLWISITRARRILSADVVTYKVLMGLRQRIRETEAGNLPEDYLGNAVRFVPVRSTAGEILGLGLGRVALLINRAVASQTVSEVRGYLKSWGESPTLPQVGSLPANELVTGSSPRFDVYGCDFGWGSPVAVRSGPGNKFDGKLTVFPGSVDGSVDFEACLYVETLDAMDSDPEFTHSLA